MTERRLEFVVAGVAAVATAIGFIAASLIVCVSLDGDARRGFVEALNIILPAGLILSALGGVLAVHYFRSFIVAARRLGDEIDLIATVNPGHRVEPTGPRHLHKLGRSINRLAGRLWEALEQREVAVEEGRIAVENEKERLAALMSDLAQGVVVCNLDGQILLYNAEARQLLADDEASYVGLGRSVFIFLDRHVVLNALHHLQLRAERSAEVRPQRFIATIPGGQVLRMAMAAVRGAEGAFTGFVLTMDDVTEERAARGARDDLLRSLTRDGRRSIAGTRTAIEAIRSYPSMPSDEIDRFLSVIADEVEHLSASIDDVSRQHVGTVESAWEIDDMLGDDLVLALAKRVEDTIGLEVKARAAAEDVWVRIDGLALVDRLAELTGKVAGRSGAGEMRIGVQASGRFVVIDMSWPDGDVDELELSECIGERSESGDDLETLMDRHGGEIWCELDSDDRVVLRVLLPKAAAVPSLAMRVHDESRPEFYDFDLFDHRDTGERLDERPLRSLVYTVFDTETTGLNPSQGDEVISIGAVRILNGKILRHESFDQLVDPRRGIPADSFQIHKISAEMLAGQPTIDVVLPRFARFVEDTVLIGHNVAFDLKFLQLKEKETDVIFSNPVLDTLLLAAVVYPDAEVHSLETLARLVGIEVTGLHTSLGDALVTAELFLRLIPLLEERGLHTFGQVQEAERRTFYSRLEY